MDAQSCMRHQVIWCVFITAKSTILTSCSTGTATQPLDWALLDYMRWMHVSVCGTKSYGVFLYLEQHPPAVPPARPHSRWTICYGCTELYAAPSHSVYTNNSSSTNDPSLAPTSCSTGTATQPLDWALLEVEMLAQSGRDSCGR
jgi:hypothetical protein